MFYIGIDPGNSGALAIREDLKLPEYFKFDKLSMKDVSDIFEGIASKVGEKFAMLEKVHAFPGQGVVSVATFIGHARMLEAFLVAFKIPYELVPPQTWQKVIGCMTHGDKNVSKAKAQGLFPTLKITHANADALLIMDYCYRTVFPRREDCGILL